MGLANHFIAMSETEKCPVFVHFDEVGSMNEDKNGVQLLRNIRMVAESYWLRLPIIAKQYADPSQIPRLYFYFSGKGVNLRALNRRINTEWLILSPFTTKCVTDLRQQLASQGSFTLQVCDLILCGMCKIFHC